MKALRFIAFFSALLVASSPSAAAAARKAMARKKPTAKTTVTVTARNRPPARRSRRARRHRRRGDQETSRRGSRRRGGEKAPEPIRFTVQAFGEKHHHLLNQEDHSGCDVHGSAFLPADAAAVVKAGQPANASKNTNSPLGGVVLAVQKALTLGESEVVIGISNATTALKAGEFVPALDSTSRVMRQWR